MAFSIMRAKILSAIKQNEPISVSELCRKLDNYSKGSAIYRYLKELQKRGLISTHKQGKKTMLSTTPKAKPIMPEIFKLQDKVADFFN